MLKRRRRVKDIESIVKAATTKTDDDFVRDYLVKHPEGSSSPWTTSWTHPTTATVYSLTLSQSLNTSTDDLDACFRLVEETSRADYAASSRGWNPKAKRREMRDPDLRYLLVREAGAPSSSSSSSSSSSGPDPPDPGLGPIRAFASLMPTAEEGQPVVYCYEIHLVPALRGTGLARLLMGCLEAVARNADGVEKLMLTVFTCNARALAFYRRCGLETDDMSPRRRRLRGGVVKDPDYAIMSKRVGRPHGARQNAAGLEDASAADGRGDVLDRPVKIAKPNAIKASLQEGVTGEA